MKRKSRKVSLDDPDGNGQKTWEEWFLPHPRQPPLEQGACQQKCVPAGGYGNIFHETAAIVGWKKFQGSDKWAEKAPMVG